MLALSHPTGVGATVALVAGLAAVNGVRRSWRVVREHWRAAWLGLSVLALGVSGGMLWAIAYGASTGIEFHGIGRALAQTPGNYWDFTNQLVAGFGYLEFRLPRIVYLAWFLFIATLVVAALSTGSRRDREVILAGGALMVVVPILLWLLVGRAIGNGMSGRLFLPVLVAFPMLCGEVVYRQRQHLGRLSSRALSWSGSLVGVVQFTAWYLNARRAAVGTHGPLLFVWHPRWAPPLGWPLWLGCAALGAALLCSFCWPAQPQRAEYRSAALA
jgi:hypothetical protein